MEGVPCPFIHPDIIRSAVHKVLTVCTHWSNAGQVLARLVKFPTLNLQRSDLERKIRIYKRMKSATALDFPSEDYILIYDWTELSPWTNTVNLWLGSKLTYSVPMVGEIQFTTQEQQKPFFFLGLSKIDDQPTFCIHKVVVVTWILTSEWRKLCYFIFSVFGILLHGWSERYFTFWQWTGCLVLWGAESHLCLSGLGSAEECNKRLLHKDQPMTYPRMVTECTLVRAFVISQDQCWLLAHVYNYFVHTCNIEREVFVKYSFCFIQIRN